VISYRAMLDVPVQLVVFVSELLAAHRRELGTRSGTRKLTCPEQAVFALAWFWDRPDTPRLGAGSGCRRPPPAGTSMRSSRCWPHGHQPCGRPWTGRKKKACRT
jgi:hypothetical protein